MSKANSGISSLGTVGTFIKRGTCSETSFCVLNRAFDNPLKEEEQAAMPFAGGIMQHGYQCGLIWGATLAAGAQAYHLLGAGPHAETKAIIAAIRLVESFRVLNKNNVNCLEITELDKSSSTMQMITYFLIKGGTIGCFRRAAKYAHAAFSEINAALSDEEIETPPAPVSCSAVLAQKMGASPMHATMAAGLAGGIGLSGGACGALGAAIWISGVNSLKKQGGKINFKDRRAAGLIDRFLRCTDYEFECSKIVGRRFKNVGDHAGYLCGGGCSKIIEVLAAKGPTG
ncbi:MAG: C-GCAxxG-C-C family protein [candidate division Zixibacteria bacterium]|nr:C-GCAxxG-C-C family protein [candidate division Zixibacteria bacterium]